MAPGVALSRPADGVGQILIDAPPRNVGSTALFAQVYRALAELREGGARVVVVGSAVPGYFVAHGSLTEIVAMFGEGRFGDDPNAHARVLRELDRGAMVSIAAVDGQAWGGGAELAWACDLRVASRTASFAQPEVNVGVTPGLGGAAKLARLAGEAAALRLVLDGRPVDAEEAYRLRLVDRLADGSAVDAAVEWATWIASRPPWAPASNKALVKAARDVSLRDALRHELATFAEHCARPDALELIRAAQSRYDAGGDSYDAFGLPRP